MSQSRSPAVLFTCLAGTALSPAAFATDYFVAPGGTYEEVSEAIAVAAPGDRIFVAPGQYRAFDLSKPLEIRGSTTGTTRIGAFDDPARTLVTGIPAGTVATLSNMSFDPANFATFDFGAQVSVTDNQGTVVLQNIETNTSPLAWHIGPGVVAENTQRLVIQGSTIEGISTEGFPTVPEPGLVARDTHLEVSDSGLFAGGNGSDSGAAGPAGAYLEDSTAYFVRVRAKGGPGSGDVFFEGPGGAGVELVSSSLVLAGGPANLIEGSSGPSQGGPGLQIDATSSATIAADVVLEGGPNFVNPDLAPEVSAEPGGTVDFLSGHLPGLVPQEHQLAVGAPFTLEHTGEPNALVVPAYSLPLGPALTVGGLNGTLHLDVSVASTLPAVALDGGGNGTTSASVPALPPLAGLHVWFQAFEVAGAIYASNPMRLEISL